MNTIELIQCFEPEDLYKKIWSENAKIIAQIILCMEPYKVPDLFERFTINAQIDIIKNIINMEEIHTSELKYIDDLLLEEALSTAYEYGLKKGGIHAVVEILNFTHVKVFKKIIDIFENQEPELADEILKKIFVLEDIVMLDKDFLKRALLEIDNKELAIAFKGLDKIIQERVFSNITKEREKIIKKEMKNSGPMPEKDVEDAKFRVYKIIRKMKKNEEKI